MTATSNDKNDVQVACYKLSDELRFSDVPQALYS
jgi:hypothetical protein